MGINQPCLKLIKIIYIESQIKLISIFPSGKIVSVSYDKLIRIYDNNYNIIQIISNAHDDFISCLQIKNENNFVTSAWLDIKTWSKNLNENKFILNKIIKNAHYGNIFNVLYLSNENLISCSSDKSIRIWEENNNEYQLITLIIHSDEVNSILLLEDKNIFLSFSLNIQFWNLKNYEYICQINNKVYAEYNSLKRIDDDRIIMIEQNRLIKVISINNKKIIYEIKNNDWCYEICVIECKKIFLIGGKNKEIKIYRNDNYECIKIINNCHEGSIFGLLKLNNNVILTYGNDDKIKIWSL